MLAAMVSSNSTVSCVTMPICARSDAQRDVADVDAVDQDRAAGDVVEPRQQVDQRRLAGAAAADDRDHLAGADRERHAAQRAAAVAVVVAERARRGTRSRRGTAAAARRRALRRTSVCVSSISKIRSDAAIACCRLALTRLSFLTGPYIRSSAAMNEVNSPAVRRPVRDLAAAVPQRAGNGDAAEELHQRRQHATARASPSCWCGTASATRARTSPPRAPRRRTP